MGDPGRRRFVKQSSFGHQGIEEFMKKFPFTPYVLENYRTSTARVRELLGGFISECEDDSVLIAIQIR